jgi:AraC-like DNA-binding protein
MPKRPVRRGPMCPGMSSQMRPLSIPVPGVRAYRLFSDGLHSGMKETYSIARVESGRSEWWSAGRVWSLQPGCLQLLQPGDVFRIVSRDGPGTAQVVSLPAGMVERVTGKIRVRPRIDASDPSGAPFQELHRAIQSGAGPFELEVALADAIAALARVGDATLDHTRPVRRAVELLRERLAEAVTLDELAAHADYDKFRLCRAFRAQIGMPPHAYRTRLRIMRAKELLAAGTRPSDVAARVGLYDQSQLNRHFRRIVGTTPARYAAQAQR